MKPPPRSSSTVRGLVPGSPAGCLALALVTLGLGAIGFGLPERAQAQSLMAREGLGLPIDPLGARARGLGSAGIGLTGWSVSPVDPAASAGLGLPSISASLRPATTTLTDGREAGFTRFPTLAVSYPLGANVFSVQAGSFFDQEWEVRLERTLVLGGEEVPALDVYSSDGGIGRVQVGWARRIVPSLAVGMSFGTHVGTIERSFTRRIQAAGQVSEDFGAFGVRGRLRASGVLAGVGAVWDPLPLVRVGGSVLWSDDLTLEPSGSAAAVSGEYSVPLQLHGGGTVGLTQDLSLHLSGAYADWSDINEDLDQATSKGATWSYGGGVEWGGSTVLGRTFPLRLGARHRDLPFESGGEAAFERTLSGGFGLNLVEVEGEDDPRARADLGVERGTRDGGPVSESFWRITFTLRVSSG